MVAAAFDVASCDVVYFEESNISGQPYSAAAKEPQHVMR